MASKRTTAASPSPITEYVKTRKERQSQPPTEPRQLTNSQSGALQVLKSQMLANATAQCTAIAKSRHVQYLADQLMLKGVEVYDPGQNLESVYNLCRLHEVAIDQTTATHPELRCKNESMFGAETCANHTSARTRAQVRSRMATLISPAIERARQIIETSPQHGPVVALIKHVWDVNGFKPTEKLELEMNSNPTNALAGLDYSQLTNQELTELIQLIRKMRNEGATIKLDASNVIEIPNVEINTDAAIGNAVNITPDPAA